MLPPYRLLMLLQPEGARLIPSLLQEISKDRTMLTGCVGLWLYRAPNQPRATIAKAWVSEIPNSFLSSFSPKYVIRKKAKTELNWMERISFWSLLMMLIYWLKKKLLQRKHTDALLVVSKEVNLKANGKKMKKDMFMPLRQTTRQNHCIEVE